VQIPTTPSCHGLTESLGLSGIGAKDGYRSP